MVHVLLIFRWFQAVVRAIDTTSTRRSDERYEWERINVNILPMSGWITTAYPLRCNEHLCLLFILYAIPGGTPPELHPLPPKKRIFQKKGKDWLGIC